MKRLLYVLVILSILLTALALPASAKPSKVMLCHRGRTISVAQPAVAGHVAHGDSLGACGIPGS